MTDEAANKLLARLADVEKKLSELEARPPSVPTTVMAQALDASQESGAGAIVGAGTDGGAFVFLRAPGGTPRLGMGIGPTGVGNLLLLDGEQTKRTELQIALNECPRMVFFHGDGSMRIDWSVDPRGAAVVAHVLGQTGAAIAMLARADGSPAVRAAGKKDGGG